MANPDLPLQLGSMHWEVTYRKKLGERTCYFTQKWVGPMLCPDLDVTNQDVNVIRRCPHKGLLCPGTEAEVVDVRFKSPM